MKKHLKSREYLVSEKKQGFGCSLNREFAIFRRDLKEIITDFIEIFKEKGTK